MAIVTREEYKTAMQNYRDAVEKNMQNEKIVTAELKKIYEFLEKYLNSDIPEFKNNGLIKLIKLKLLSFNQVLQIVGPRGRVSDINGTIFPYPINSSYFEGIKTTWASLIETRSATISCMNTKTPIQDTETCNRRMALAVMGLLKLQRGPYRG
jgi:hypothetical protein